MCPNNSAWVDAERWCALMGAGSAQGAQDDLIRIANYAVQSLSVGAKTVPAGDMQCPVNA